MPADGGQAQQVTRNGGQTALESADGKSLYFTKSDGGVEGLFSVPVEGGEERQVLKDVVPARGFVVVPDGIYYISPAKPDLADRGAFLVIGHRRAPESWKLCEIRFYTFSTGRSVVLGEIGGPISLGLTVSPDRKTLLYSRRADEADLFMIEGFR
jgi:Tol biopolymer transport system component